MCIESEQEIQIRNCYCHIIQQEEVNEIMNIKCVRMRNFCTRGKKL